MAKKKKMKKTKVKTISPEAVDMTNDMTTTDDEVITDTELPDSGERDPSVIAEPGEAAAPSPDATSEDDDGSDDSGDDTPTAMEVLVSLEPDVAPPSDEPEVAFSTETETEVEDDGVVNPVEATPVAPAPVVEHAPSNQGVTMKAYVADTRMGRRPLLGARDGRFEVFEDGRATFTLPNGIVVTAPDGDVLRSHLSTDYRLTEVDMASLQEEDQASADQEDL